MAKPRLAPARPRSQEEELQGLLDTAERLEAVLLGVEAIRCEDWTFAFPRTDAEDRLTPAERTERLEDLCRVLGPEATRLAASLRRRVAALRIAKAVA